MVSCLWNTPHTQLAPSSCCKFALQEAEPSWGLEASTCLYWLTGRVEFRAIRREWQWLLIRVCVVCVCVHRLLVFLACEMVRISHESFFFLSLKCMKVWNSSDNVLKGGFRVWETRKGYYVRKENILEGESNFICLKCTHRRGKYVKCTNDDSSKGERGHLWLWYIICVNWVLFSRKIASLILSFYGIQWFGSKVRCGRGAAVWRVWGPPTDITVAQQPSLGHSNLCAYSSPRWMMMCLVKREIAGNRCESHGNSLRRVSKKHISFQRIPPTSFKWTQSIPPSSATCFLVKSCWI